jgi:phosphoserine phosphatase
MKIFVTFLLLNIALLATQTDPLSSWNEGVSKQSILNYVTATTDPKSPDFIPEVDRIAVFDNDGTLWSEQPAYFQLLFALDRVKALAPQHPEWKTTQPFQAVLEDDMKTLLSSGQEWLVKLLMTTHAGMSDEVFDVTVKEWIATAKHPSKNVPYASLIYQPMLELLDYLRANGFTTFIVSGGGIDFMRPWASEVYGIPSHQIIGSSLGVKYENKQIIKEAKLGAVDDKEGKPVHIHNHIGKRPVAAFGNSDGDFAMMEYTEANTQYKTFELYVHHTDEKREWAYDRKSHIGKLDKGLDYGMEHNWTIVDMKNDWKVIYPFELSKNKEK